MDGEWELAFDDACEGEAERWYERPDVLPLRIHVPYAYQSRKSGLGEEIMHQIHEVLWYKKRIYMEREWKDRQIFLHFGAVDYEAKLWVNGQMVGGHTGGYSSFSFDITRQLNFGQDNTIVLRVFDDCFSREQPRGKQSWRSDNFECWYTRYTGIWQTVWLEMLHPIHIESLTETPHLNGRNVDLELDFSACGEGLEWRICVAAAEREIADLHGRVQKQHLSLSIDLSRDEFSQEILPWFPETPFLYDVSVELLQNGLVVDRRNSYFGLRDISTQNGYVLLNNIPIYQKLVLYQGYYPGGLVTSVDDEEIVKDLQLIRDMGFNGLRIHQKIESPRFLYWCDRMGMLVWEEMPSFYEYSQKSMRAALEEWLDILKRDKGHPCIVTWVLFNESWGLPNLLGSEGEQNFVRSMAQLTHAFDGTRPIIDNDGWEHTDSTDLISIHDYGDGAAHYETTYADKDKLLACPPSANFPRFLFTRGQRYRGQPVLLTEYGGIAFDRSDGWGYNRKVQSEAEFIELFRSLTNAVQAIPYLRGYCYTQFADVEQEQNGLLTIGREPKADLAAIRRINSGR